MNHITMKNNYYKILKMKYNINPCQMMIMIWNYYQKCLKEMQRIIINKILLLKSKNLNNLKIKPFLKKGNLKTKLFSGNATNII